MKKVFAVLLILFASVCMYANEESIFSDIPGSYAIYHDVRFDEEAIIGICYVGDDSIIARTYEPETGNEVVLLMNFVINGNEIDLGSNLRILTGDINASENTRRLLPMVMNWSVSWYASKEAIMEKDRYSLISDDDYYYSSYIPVFQIDTIGNDGGFEVFSIGVVRNLQDERFFNITGIPEPVDADSYTIPDGKAIEVIIDGLQIQLDSNWKTTDERIYRLEKITPQDAAFMIETFNYKERGFASLKQLANLLLIANQDVILLAHGSKIEYKDDAFCITSRIYDPSQKKVTFQEALLIDRNDGYVSVVTLACYETLYVANKKYFDAILF